MTTNTPDKVTAAELRDWMQRVEGSLRSLVHDVCTARDWQTNASVEIEEMKVNVSDLNELINSLREELKSIIFTQRASPTPTPESNIETIVTTAIVKSYDPKGNVMLHIQGGRYSRHGVRVWPEYENALGIDQESLKPGPNPWQKRIIVKPAEDGHAPKAIGLAQ